MEKDLTRKYPEVISVRLTKNEKREFDLLMESRETNKSSFLRKKIRRVLKSISTKQ